jgi:aryl-alcohol dehydrogenase-like predicted oxidoreductase
MKTKQLGNSDISVPPLVIGGNVFGWTADEATSFDLLDACMDVGFNVIDTADVYTRMPPLQGGESETVIGNWLKRRGARDRVVIATKVGWDMGPAGKGLSKTYIRAAVEASLHRLQTDYIDLYQAHIDDPTTPLEETLEAFGELVKEGKVRWIGASNYNPARLKEALAVSDQLRLPRFESVQPRYNLYDRADYEAELEVLCKEEGLGVITYFSLASGFLSGKYRAVAELEGNRRGMWLKEYFSPRGQRILKVLRDVAAQQHATPAQVALAWVMARPGVTAPIASATSLDQLAELVASARLHLDDTALEALDAASALLEG